MLVAAALVPDTALVVPGASGRDDVAAHLRAAAVGAVRRALQDADRVVVVAPRAPRPRSVPGGARSGDGTPPEAPAVALVGDVRISLTAEGVPDHLRTAAGAVAHAPRTLELPGAGLPDDRVGAVDGPAAVGLFLLDEAGWTGPTSVVTVARSAAGDVLRGIGAALATTAGRLALVVVGSASGRHGPDGPLADDAAALPFDEALLADLQTADVGARARLAALSGQVGAALAVTGLAPWHVLVGAVAPGASVEADVTGYVLLGAQHVVGSWRIGELVDAGTDDV